MAATYQGLTICILAWLLAGPALAWESIPSTGRLAVGSTGITCVTEPCPWRGVVELDNERRDPLRPFWSGERLPRLDASAEDAARIKAAWDAMECLEIEGMIASAPGEDAAPFIRVDRIVGACQ